MIVADDGKGGFVTSPPEPESVKSSLGDVQVASIDPSKLRCEAIPFSGI